MSYWISIGDMNISITSNLSPMWDKAMPNLNLRDMDEMKAEEVIETLAKGVEYMAKNREAFLPLEPENKWGDYGGALATLVNMLIECTRNPNDTIRVST